VAIEISYKEEDGQPVFVVRDNGVGFSMKYFCQVVWSFSEVARLG
jgi:light-regulated signal transduction histidine kinase (bacteriophytochrome)